jgi:hypothetical protein
MFRHLSTRFEGVVRGNGVADVHLAQAPHGPRGAGVTEAANDADVAAVLQPAHAVQQHGLHL